MTLFMWLIAGFVYFIGVVITYWIIDEKNLDEYGKSSVNADIVSFGILSFLWPVFPIMFLVAATGYVFGWTMRKIKHSIKKSRGKR